MRVSLVVVNVEMGVEMGVEIVMLKKPSPAVFLFLLFILLFILFLINLNLLFQLPLFLSYNFSL
jgi:hypothetical protein